MLQTTPPREARSDVWTIACVDSLEGMERIGEAWHALEARAADPLTYFQSFDWCRNWCAFYAADHGRDGPAIRIYTAYLAGQLVALWPLMLTKSRLGVRKIVALTEPHGQYGNILIDTASVPQHMVVDLVQLWLRAINERETTDAVVFDSVPASALPETLAARSDLTAVQVGLNSSMDLTPFAGCYETYRAGLKGRTRRARNKRRNKLAALGTLDYCVHFGGTPEYRDLIRTGIEMKREWLEHTGRATMALNLPRVPEFLGALSNNAQGDDGAVAAALTLDGRPIAVEIGFLYHRRFYSYLGSFDWELRDYSPGKLQLEEALKWCMERGVETYDLLGEPGAYKSDWRNATEELVAYRQANSLRGRVYLSLWCDRLKPLLKRSFERTPLQLRARLAPVIENRSTAAQTIATAR